MQRSHPLQTILRWAFYVSLALFIASCWNRDHFPDDRLIMPGLEQAPEQTTASDSAFVAEQGGTAYEIQPRFDYELAGLVVSYKAHNAKFGLHKRWNDHLNVADVCVVWGGNAEDLDLNALDFWNGQFTCNVQTKDREAWERFAMDGLSNNHLLSDDEYIRDRIKEVRIGDQIMVRGWLADYRNAQGFSRKTSTNRTDTGNGACETIYVQEFEILHSMANGWRAMMNLSLLALIASSVIWVLAVVRGVF